MLGAAPTRASCFTAARWLCPAILAAVVVFLVPAAAGAAKPAQTPSVRTTTRALAAQRAQSAGLPRLWAVQVGARRGGWFDRPLLKAAQTKGINALVVHVSALRRGAAGKRRFDSVRAFAAAEHLYLIVVLPAGKARTPAARHALAACRGHGSSRVRCAVQSGSMAGAVKLAAKRNSARPLVALYISGPSSRTLSGLSRGPTSLHRPILAMAPVGRSLDAPAWDEAITQVVTGASVDLGVAPKTRQASSAVEQFAAMLRGGVGAHRRCRHSATRVCPPTPTGLAVSSVGQTSMTLSWVSGGAGVAGYRLFLDGSQVGTTTTTSYSFTGLSCGTSYTLGVAAYDAAGDVSSTATVTHSTSSCGTDTEPPTTPTGLAAGGVAQTSITLSWNASTDNVGVAGYDVYDAGSLVGTTTSTGYTLAGLTCGTTYTLAVDAFDAAGNHSALSTPITATTSSCSSGGGDGLANIFVSPTGTSCHRFSTPVAYPGASNSCGPTQLAGACTLAQAGDTIIVEDGTYSGSKLDSCTGKTSTVTFTTEPGQGCTYSAATPFEQLPGVQQDTSCPVTFTSELSMRGNSTGGTVQNLDFEGIYFNDIYMKYANHITLDHVQSKFFFVRSSDSVAITNGDYGNQFDGTCPTVGAAGSGLPASTSITISGNIFHDLRRDLAPTEHPDGLFVQESDGITISDNVFYRNDVIPLYVNAIFGGSVSNITIIGNVIHTSTDHTSGTIGGGTLTGNTNTMSLGNNSLVNATVAFNTVSGAIRRQESPGPTTNLQVYGNLADQLIENNSAGCSPGGTYAYNVLYGSSAKTCSSTDTATGADPFVSDDVLPDELILGDLRLNSGTVAAASVPTSWCANAGICPASDLIGEARPNPNHSSALDAGAYENR